MSEFYPCDIAVLGGGIAGLWTFALLKSVGYHVVLVENKQLGSGQTGWSQGILHAGVKYSLPGEATRAAEAAHESVKIWQEALQGIGVIDLSSLIPSSAAHCLVIQGGFQAKLKAILTTQLVASHSRLLSPADYPLFFQESAFHGTICQLDEVVLNVPQLIQLFSDRYSEHFLYAETVQPHLNAEGTIETLQLYQGGRTITLQPRFTVLTAGEGNEALLASISNPPLMQRRPLHMVAVKHQALKPVWAHILETGSTPAMTITTHGGDHPFWYLGGALAENDGVVRDEAAQIQVARSELERHFPWISLQGAEWRLIRINRAEEKTQGGKRPDQDCVTVQYRQIVCWPTKLVLAPTMAKRVLAAVLSLLPQPVERERSLAYWPKPRVALGIQGVFG